MKVGIERGVLTRQCKADPVTSSREGMGERRHLDGFGTCPDDEQNMR